jgi:hypothetical protein
MSESLIKAHLRLGRIARRAATRMSDETGDVPGWVLITLMTAALVTGIWAVAGPQLESMFIEAMNGVTGP